MSNHRLHINPSQSAINEGTELHIEILEERIEKLKQELAEAYKEGYREGFLAAREQQFNKFK